MIILLLVGIILVILETLLPSGGILGILATACLIGAIALGFMQSQTTGWLILLAILIFVPILVLLGLKALPSTPFGRKMILAKHQQDEDSRGRAGVDDENFELLKGKSGITITALRPSGNAEIDGKRYSVVSESEMIEPSVEIVVKDVEGNNIVVGRKNV
ncbi:MAG: NfeD family protein [Sedimentisphaerales bacterium]